MDALLRSMKVFVAIVDSGSMAAAARQLDLSSSAVTQQIQKLEQQLTIHLLHRNTRKLTLTEAGQLFYHSSLHHLKEWQHTQYQLSTLRDEPAGQLRVSVPVGIATSGLLSEPLRQLMRSHEHLNIRLFVQDEPMDLVANRLDLALIIRTGPMPDSSLVVRHLLTINMILAASPAYLAQHGYKAGQQPKTAEELKPMDWLQHNNSGPAMHKMTGPAGTLQLEAQAKMKLNNMQTLVQFVRDGLGFAVLPQQEIQPYLHDGSLVHLLPEWSLPSIDLCAVTSTRQSQPAKVKTAIEILAAELKELPRS